MRQKWSKENIIKELQRLSSDLDNLIPNKLVKSSGGLYNIATKEFGTYQDAVLSAGIDYEKLKELSKKRKGEKFKKWTKETIIQGINELHKQGVSLFYNTAILHNQPLVVAAAKKHYFGSWRDAVKAAGIEYKDKRHTPIFRKWNKQIVLDKLSELSNQGEPLNSNYHQKNNMNLHAAAVRFFGSWEIALNNIGINYEDIRLIKDWSKVTNLDEYIKPRLEKLEKFEKLNSSYVAQNHRQLFYLAQKEFGSWENLLTKFGYDYTAILEQAAIERIAQATKWNKDDIISEIASLYEQGIQLNVNNMVLTKPALFQATVRIFGQWSTAIELAGLDYSKISKTRPNNYWTKEKVLEEIKNLTSKNIDLNYLNIFNNYNYLLNAARRSFGSWESAIEASGLNYEEIRKQIKGKSYTEDEIKNFVQKAYQAGKDINAQYFIVNYVNFYNSAVRKFGSWENIITSIGLNYSDIRKNGQDWDKEKILKQIGDLVIKQEPLNSRFIRQYDRFLYNAARLHFGKWENALEEYGIDYDLVRKEPTREILLGKAFESLCNKMFTKLNYDYIYQPRFVFEDDICIPDFVDLDDNWVEIKINSLTATITATVDKYTKYKDGFKIIHLLGKERTNLPNIQFIPIDTFYEPLRTIKADKIIESFEALKKGEINFKI